LSQIEDEEELSGAGWGGCCLAPIVVQA